MTLTVELPLSLQADQKISCFVRESRPLSG